MAWLDEGAEDEREETVAGRDALVVDGVVGDWETCRVCEEEAVVATSYEGGSSGGMLSARGTVWSWPLL
jgi:hypothetical protein